MIYVVIFSMTVANILFIWAAVFWLRAEMIDDQIREVEDRIEKMERRQ